MKIKMGNVYAKVEDATAEEMEFASGYLSWDDPRARFTPAVKHGTWDGKVRLLNVSSGLFPAGNVPGLVRAMTEELGQAPEIEDMRAPPCARDPGVDLAWLATDPRWDWQPGVIDAAIAKTRGILWIPTGGGKTNIAVALAQALPCKWLFVVHTTKLMHQAAERFEKLTGEPAGRVGDGQWHVERFTTATFQTLWSGLRARRNEAMALVQDREGLFVDECHTLPASTFYKVVMRMARAYWRFGLSGTPLARGDLRSVYAVSALGPVIYRVRAETLIQRGVLARPVIRMVNLAQTGEYPTWQGTYGALVVRSQPRNRTLVEIARRAAKPALIFVKEIRHGRQLKEFLLRDGLRVEFVWGAKATASRDASVQRLERGDIDVLICSVIFQEGVDIPSLASVVIAAGGRSNIASIQRIGRGTRSDGGRKTAVEVWDLNDSGNKLMERHAKERRRAYQREGYEVTLCDTV